MWTNHALSSLTVLSSNTFCGNYLANFARQFLNRLNPALNMFRIMTFIYRIETEDIIFFIVCGILAVATTFTNITILIVLFTNPKLMNVQAVYRISLALSDILTGIIIFPSFIYFYVSYGNVNYNNIYIDAIGFFTMLNFHVSMFTLIAAAIDRFKVVYYPLIYNAISTITSARKTCLGLWLISILLAIAPTGIIHKKFRYVLVFGTYVLPVLFTNVTTFLIYIIIVFMAPVTAMWLLKVSTFLVYKKYSEKRKKIFTTKRQRQKLNEETKLLFTLGIMVGVFSICLLPAAIVSILVITFGAVNRSLSISVAVILESNSLWDFFIYSAREKKFRTLSKKLYKKLLFC